MGNEDAKVRGAAGASSVYWQKIQVEDEFALVRRMTEDFLMKTGKDRRRLMLIAGLAVGFQGLLLGLAVLIGVMDPQPPREARLKVPPASVTASRERQQALDKQLAKLNRMQKEGLNELMNEVLDSARPEISVSRPDLQQSFQAMAAMLPASSFFQDSTAAFSGMDAGDALPLPDPVSFMGESLSATRIVLLLDVSGSVKSKIERAGLSMEALREEVHKFIDQLGPNHLFGIVQFSRKWQVFREELVPATASIKEEARQWLSRSFRTTGTSGRNWSGGPPNGIEGVLRAAFAMDPQIDQIFLVSDGDFQRTPPGGGGQDVPWADLRRLTSLLQESSIGETRLRALCFYPPEEALPDLRAWIRENGTGTVRVVN